MIKLTHITEHLKPKAMYCRGLPQPCVLLRAAAGFPDECLVAAAGCFCICGVSPLMPCRSILQRKQLHCLADEGVLRWLQRLRLALGEAWHAGETVASVAPAVGLLLHMWGETADAMQPTLQKSYCRAHGLAECCSGCSV